MRGQLVWGQLVWRHWSCSKVLCQWLCRQPQCSTVVCGALLELSEVVAGVSGVHSVLLPHLPLQHQPVPNEDPISVLL